MITRRLFLAATAAGLAGAARAAAPAASLVPVPRPASVVAAALPSGADLVAEAGLGGRVGFAVADAATGRVLEMHDGLLGLPPASCAKAVTCAYGLERLGGDFRFATRVLADGPVEDGRLDGDLWLVGGGDPHFGTDDLNGLARQLQEAGLREVTGRLHLATGLLPHIPEIDPDQPPHVGYNPAVGALNLNMNRVHFEWVREGGGYTVRMDARSETIRPAVNRMAMAIDPDRAAPVYTYRQTPGLEAWTVARSALGNGGARWLPVRAPALYAAEVFATLCRSRGLVLELGERATAPPEGATELARHDSVPLAEILASMMRYSTNITAECVGLMASAAQGGPPDSLPASGARMADWAEVRLGARNLRFVDHSGLGEESRVRARDMVAALVASPPGVRALMRPVLMRDAAGAPLTDPPVEAVAKTGTLNFVSGLSGFARGRSGRDLAFAIFCADLDRRAALPDPRMERPEGGRVWNRRAKALQQRLIERWAAAYR